ncbi:MAG TPA: hypothetical protein VF807_02280, partial [Ktedonobacterales bacterium]
MGTIFRALRDLLTGNFKGLFHLLLGLAVVVALWETALFGLSTRSTATSLFTEVGTNIVNPVISASSLGLAQQTFVLLQAQSALRPNDPLIVPGLGPKVHVLGKDIAGKTYDQAMRIIYTHVADAYYDGGASAAFALPANLQNVVSGIPLLPIGGTSSGSNGSTSPSLPSLGFFGQVLTVLGLSLNSLTASGHAQIQTVMFWSWGVAGVLALLLLLLGKGWGRINGVAGTLISGAFPGLIAIGGVFAYLHFVPNGLKGLGAIPGILGGVFIPVYVGAAVVGVGLRLAGFVGKLMTAGSHGDAGEKLARAPRREAPPAPASPSYRGGTQPMPGSGAQGFRSPGYGAPVPPSPRPDYTPPAAQPWPGNAPSSGGMNPAYPQPGYPQQPNYPGQQQGYPGQQQGYPGQQPGYPQQP